MVMGNEGNDGWARKEEQGKSSRKVTVTVVTIQTYQP